MKGKRFFKALAIKTSRFCKMNKKLAKSYVSLFVVLLLVLTATFAWFTKRNTARMGTNMMEFQSASSLRINKDKSASSKITIPAFKLDEASSLDGRNIYFPLDKSFNTVTSNMFFREGNKGDENKHYVYTDFTLKGTSGNTPVYIKSYEIKVEAADGTDHDSDVNAIYHDQLTIGYDSDGKPNSQTIPRDNCPIRLAFIADSAKQPVVIDPSAQVVDYVDYSSGVVSLVDNNGVPEIKDPAGMWNSFSSYYYGNTPLFIIPGGQSLDVTLVVWLEGTLPDCDKYIGKKISVDIDIESNFAEMETITFYDDTQPDSTGGQSHWVSNDNPIFACSYEDPFSDETPKRWKSVIMRKTADYTWTAAIPKKAVTNISFYRLSKTNGQTQSTIYNSWHTTSNISTWITASRIPNDWYVSNHMDLQTDRKYLDTNTNTYRNALVYTAVHGNGYGKTNNTAERLAPCVGYWNYNGGSGGGSSGGGGGNENQGGDSSTVYDIGVTVDSKDWVRQNADDGSKLHLVTTYGEDHTFSSHSGTHFEQHFDLKYNDEISGFYLAHPGGGRTDLDVTLVFTVKRSANVVFTQNNDDKLVPNITS